MMSHAAPPTRIPLYLSEEEALALLELCLHSRLDDDPLRSPIMRRVSGVWRDLVRMGSFVPALEHADGPRAIWDLDSMLPLAVAAAS